MSLLGVLQTGVAWTTLGYVHLNNLAAALSASETSDPASPSPTGNTKLVGSTPASRPTTPAKNTPPSSPASDTLTPDVPLTGQPAENPMMIFLRFIVGIVVVFLLMWLLWRWFKRTNLGDYEGPGLRLVSRLQLSRVSQVALIEIGGRMFLVGAGDSSVTPIAEIYDTEEMSAELSAAAEAFQERANQPVSRPFGELLARATKRVERGSRPSPQSASPKPTETRSVTPSRTAVQARLATPAAAAKAKPKSQVTEEQMDALASQIAAEFGAKGPQKPAADGQLVPTKTAPTKPAASDKKPAEKTFPAAASQTSAVSPHE
ncbi:flagellar biosynthetic protein FliO [Mobiluncus sp.]|uniref:flagellar biosynthetic protein FliO n=1 Tax=Mobiluncus sp. TaxID=47293 RepID=UPI002A919330|nr:flagellar biosynthetic protein FliO [Mobiluncus sp.]MDY6077264.1 flagellar biosynthetic protein FliO [Mobiluncus sp.]